MKLSFGLSKLYCVVYICGKFLNFYAIGMRDVAKEG
jgi:hypothetical protein